MTKHSPIGIFDSGVGGLTVLQEVAKLLPGEDIIYYGDSANAPYGTRPAEEIRALGTHNLDHLVAQDVKAVVIACNTVTATSEEFLKKRYPQYIVMGIEPAVEPAVYDHPGGRVLVMATVATLKQPRFLRQQKALSSQADIIPVPCAGLVEFVEQGILQGRELEGFLLEKLEPFTKVPVDAVVLGCTHYPFVADAIRKIVGRRPRFYQSATLVAENLRRNLAAQDLLHDQAQGTITLQNSDPNQLPLCRKLLGMDE